MLRNNCHQKSRLLDTERRNRRKFTDATLVRKKKKKKRVDIKIVTSDIRKKLFTLRVMWQWDRLPREVVGAPSLKVFKTRLNGALGNLV